VPDKEAIQQDFTSVSNHSAIAPHVTTPIALITQCVITSPSLNQGLQLIQHLAGYTIKKLGFMIIIIMDYYLNEQCEF
jgi:hypothetical protein